MSASSARRRESESRNDLRNARLPSNPLPRTRSQRNVPLYTVAVVDPYAAKERILAAVNYRTDVLEFEHKHGRLSTAAYNEGRRAQHVFLRARGPGAGNQWREGDRVDVSFTKEAAIIDGIDTAAKIVEYDRRLAFAVGQIDARLLRRILGDGKSFADCAAMEGKAGERGAWYIASRFRDALELLAESEAARGKAARKVSGGQG